MEVGLTQEEKYELSGVDEGVIEDEIRKELLVNDFLLTEEEKGNIGRLLSECLELEMESPKELEYTKASYKMYKGTIIVVKAKKLNVELLIKQFENGLEFVMGDNIFQKSVIVIKSILQLFVVKLDRDSALIYEFLARKYFIERRAFTDSELNTAISDYLNQQWDEQWPRTKVSEVLSILEKEVRVVEWNDGFLKVKDRIYFCRD